MDDLSKETLLICSKYNVDARQVAFARLLAAGADRAESYYFLFHRGTKKLTRDQANTAAATMLENNPGLKVLITQLKKDRTVNAISKRQVQTMINDQNNDEEQQRREEEIKKFKDKNYIIEKLALAAMNETGKERANILVKIADLQQMKQEENKEEEEKRRFYLPYVSKCRTCKVLKLFQEFKDTI